MQRGTQIQPGEVDTGNLCQIVTVYCVSKIKDDLQTMEDDFDMMEDDLAKMEDDL